MTEQSPEAILTGICAGRTDLLELGQRFNATVVESGAQKPGEGLDALNETVEAIFELEGIPLSEDEKHLVRQLDRLKWSDGQVLEFLQMMGRA